MKIATRLKLSFGVILAMVAVVGLAGGLFMLSSSARLSAELQRSFAITAVTEQLAALAHEHNVIVSMHAAAGTQPDAGRLEKIEADLEAALKRLEPLDPPSAAKSRDLITTAMKRGKLLLMAAADEPELEPGLEEPAAPAPRPAKAGATGAAPGAEGRIAALYAEAETYLAAQHAARRAHMNEEIVRRGRQQALLFAGLFGLLVAAGGGVAAVAFGAVRKQTLLPLQSLANLARRASAERDLRVNVELQGDEEIQELGRAFAELMDSLRRITQGMRSATARLLESAQELSRATRSQSEAVTRQAAALEEAGRTSSALRETSRLVSTQVAGVLQVAEKADSLTRAGSGAVSAGLGVVDEIRRQTEQVAGGFESLVTAVGQIGAITATVKDLADQSNLLALNATLEASRAGAAGAGFQVVAQEIRTLADRSLAATREVRQVLATLLKRVRESATLVQSAHGELEAGAGSTKLLGDSLQGLSSIVQENLGAAHRISGAVADQGAGIDQITSAVEDLVRMMEETVHTADVTGAAVSVLHDVAGKVSEAAEAFRV